jgi:hypothetical protein
LGEMFIFTGIPDRPVYLRDIMSEHRGKDINSPLTTERKSSNALYCVSQKLLEGNLDTFGKCICPLLGRALLLLVENILPLAAIGGNPM